MLECIEFERRENENENEAVDTTVDLQISRDENIVSVKSLRDPRRVNPLDSQDTLRRPYISNSPITFLFPHLQTILLKYLNCLKLMTRTK